MPKLLRRTGVCLLLLFTHAAWAHDPYEITATVYLETNAINVHMEMEFNGAMLLSGADAGTLRAMPPAEQFSARLPQLERQAGRFFELVAGGQPLALLETNVMLGVENHVEFHLGFPATDRRPLQISAPGLAGLLEHGPFGATLTVLDMVNKKVLGQSVLFDGKTVVETGAKEAGRVHARNSSQVETASVAKTDADVTAVTWGESENTSAQEPPAHSISKWVLVAVAAVAIVLALLWRVFVKAGEQGVR